MAMKYQISENQCLRIPTVAPWSSRNKHQMLGRNVHLFVQPLHKVVWHCLVRDTHSVAWHFYPQIHNLEKCRHMCSQTCTEKFIAAPFRIVPSQKQHKFPSTGVCINCGAVIYGMLWSNENEYTTSVDTNMDEAYKHDTE